MRFGQQGFALFSFSVVAWVLAIPLTAYAAHSSDGSDGSSAGSYAADGSAGDSNGGEPAADRGSDEQRAMFVLSVPADAKVYFQDEPTASTGARRRYRSLVLEAGKNFVFTIRVEVERDGHVVSNTQQPRLQAGSHVEFAFHLADADHDLVATQRAPDPSGTVRRFPASFSGPST